MLSNLHTHSTYCDGKNTPEEMILSALELGFSSLGFSGHGYERADCGYCMQDTAGYMQEIKSLREKYKNDIEIYLGVEEDAAAPVNRDDFDYIIGSSHYYKFGSEAYAVDSSPEISKKALERIGDDPLVLAENYFSRFCAYIKARRPDIIGHFDLLTKFDEKGGGLFLQHPAYHALAEKYLREALQADCLFEVNTGAISRGWRTAPYPHENLLHILKKEGGNLTITSDCHAVGTLDCHYAETKQLLKDIGFQYTYVLYGGKFVKDYL